MLFKAAIGLGAALLLVWAFILFRPDSNQTPEPATLAPRPAPEVQPAPPPGSWLPTPTATPAGQLRFVPGNRPPATPTLAPGPVDRLPAHLHRFLRTPTPAPEAETDGLTEAPVENPPAPTATPAPTPTPTTVPTATPAPTPTPTTSPTAAPTPQPDPAPTPESTGPGDEPQATTTPPPTPTPQPASQPGRTPQPSPTPTPRPLGPRDQEEHYRLEKSGRVTLRIERPEGGIPSDATMRVFLQAVRFVADYLDKGIEPGRLPQNTLQLTFSEIPPRQGIGLLPFFETEPEQRRQLGFHLAAGVAYYFQPPDFPETRWLSDGAGNFISLLYNARYHDWLITADHGHDAEGGHEHEAGAASCGPYSSLKRLEQDNPGPEDVWHYCPTALAESLFTDLYVSMSPDQFREGFRRLFRADAPGDTARERLRQAFPDQTGIIDRAYEGR